MDYKYILALDQGTTSSRAIIFDLKSNIKGVAQQEFRQIFPNPGWVEHDANEIWESQLKVLKELSQNDEINNADIACLGITNQRETTIVWDRATGQPIHNAIVWQDNRTAKYCDTLIANGHTELFKQKTGLILNPYFSGTKLRYILHTVDGAMERAQRGELAFGTVDSWLIWNLTSGKTHATDVTNASRTLLFNIHTLEWDQELLNILDIPKAILPEVHASDHNFGTTSKEITGLSLSITGVAGDQQAALFGQQCTKPGMLKNTYGTGCFLMVNTGDKAVTSQNNLLTTIGWKQGGKVTYALEGSVFIGGSVIQWLRDGLQIIDDAKETEEMAQQLNSNEGVYLVPAFTGLGAPHWDASATGTLIGLTRGTERNHIVRAALESIAYQTKDVVTAMEADLGRKITELRVDGGAVGNSFLMQFQSDIVDTEVIIPQVMETTALGVAYLAGLGAGIYKSLDDISDQWKASKEYSPQMDDQLRSENYNQWLRAVERSKKWSE